MLAATQVLAFLAWQWRWIHTRLTVAISIPTILALLQTQTRAGILALLVAVIYLFGRRYYKLLIPIALASLLVVAIISSTRQINSVSFAKQITSDRIYLWNLAWQGIKKRPLLGWGFDGFGTAYPYALHHSWAPRVVRLGDFDVDYQDKNGQFRRIPLISVKAHNLILDTTLSVGLIGLVLYVTLLGFYLYQYSQQCCPRSETVVIAYLVFTFTWFECAQFTHIIWWSLSTARANNVDILRTS